MGHRNLCLPQAFHERRRTFRSGFFIISLRVWFSAAVVFYRVYYWGSRTSDGAEEGLCFLAPYGDIFAEACERNFRLLESCSAEGYLFGGLMYKEYGEDPCTHHSFCHAKAVAAMIDSGFQYEKKAVLPRDREYGLKHFDSIHVNLISMGDWRASVNDTDAVHYDGAATTGGTMTLLWHRKVGPVLAATMANYSMSEPRNMQRSRFDDAMPCTSLRMTVGDFASVNEKLAFVTVCEEDERVTIAVKGVLRDLKFCPGPEYEWHYTFSRDVITIAAKASEDGFLHVPVICSKDDRVSVSGNQAVIFRKGVPMTVTCDGTSFVPVPDMKIRHFNVVGGFGTFPLKLMLKKGHTAVVTIRIGD